MLPPVIVANPNQPINKLVGFHLQPSGDAVSLLENVALISDGTTGLVTWEAALYLAEWALDHQQTFTNRSVCLLDITDLFRSHTKTSFKLTSALWLQDGSGAGQWCRTDWHHHLSLLQAKQIYLQWLPPWCPAEAEEQHQAKWTDGGDSSTGQGGGVGLGGGDRGADQADGCWCCHGCRW